MPTRLDVTLVGLPTSDRLTTSTNSNPAADRELVFIQATDDEGNVGWGECSALNTRGYTPEWARGSFGVLTSGIPVEPTQYPMAFAGVEMALLDLQLRTESKSLATYLGASEAMVQAGATVGLGPITETLNKIDDLAALGYRRVKLKIGPDEIVNRTAAVRDRFDQLEIQVDANGSLGKDDLNDLAALAAYDVTAIEQPFAPDARQLVEELQERVNIKVMADEAIRTPNEMASRGFYDGVVVKPGPIGGVDATMRLIELAKENGLSLSAGGMLEGGLGRHCLAAVAACNGFDVTGDLSPARRWLLQDPWPDLEMTNGRIATPSGAGVAPTPDVELLDRFEIARGQVLRHQ